MEIIWIKSIPYWKGSVLGQDPPVEQKNTIRTIDSISVESIHRFKVIRVVVRGHSFLHYMIRRIVGAALTVASHDYEDVTVLKKALADKNPQQTLPKAPACGLMLYKIQYRD